MALAAAVPFLTAGAHAGEPAIAAIDWGLLETALAIGAVPVAATELRQFRKIAVEPEVPDRVADLGLRGSPSFELLRVIEPDLILISGFYEYQRASLERIAPVLALPSTTRGPAYPLANIPRRAGEQTGRTSRR